jgi:hypothetical protein
VLRGCGWAQEEHDPSAHEMGFDDAMQMVSRSARHSSVTVLIDLARTCIRLYLALRLGLCYGSCCTGAGSVLVRVYELMYVRVCEWQENAMEMENAMGMGE